MSWKQVVTRICGWIGLACCLMLQASCSSGSGHSARITFPDLGHTTVFTTGSVRFEIMPALGEGESATCRLDGKRVETCLLDEGSGEIPFSDLRPGLHSIGVDIQSPNGSERRSLRFEVVPIEIVVYGATPGGIAAAIAAARRGHAVAILEPTRWVGGMMSSGLSATDVGWRGHEVISGLSEEVFEKIRRVIASRKRCPDSSCDGRYELEPQSAERAFEELLAASRVIVERSARLLDVRKDGTKIIQAITTRGEVSAEVFIDASYEGDLMARSGVEYRIGREPRVMADPPDDPEQLAWQEDTAGTRRITRALGLYLDPYQVPGDPSSGPVRYVEPRPDVLPAEGEGDSRVMAYTYRLCVTDDPENRIPFTPPDGYDPADYEGSARVAQGLSRNGVDLAVRMFNPARTVASETPGYYKYDLNGGSTFSIDMTAPDMNQAYVEASEAERELIRERYRHYIRGLLYFWQTDPRFEGLNAKIARFGYCRDEFVDRGNWPHQLYVREARRMVGEYIMNENDVMQNGRRPPISDPIGFAAYNLDVHTVRYLVAPMRWPDGVVRDTLAHEGFLILRQPDDRPYPVSYRALVPRREQATNLLNPVTVSATHIAYSSLRMEPTFMMMGEAAGEAAALAIESSQSVQTIDYATLRQRLLKNGQVLTLD